jgi:hypothetical protein
VIGVGDRTVVVEIAPCEVAGYAATHGIHAWNGCNYVWELAESLGIRDSGSLVRSVGALQRPFRRGLCARGGRGS